MSERLDLHAQWRLLEASTANHTAIELGSWGGHAVSLALTPADRLHQVAMAVSKLTVISDELSTSEILIENRHLKDSKGSPQDYVLLTCRSPALNAGFDIFIEHLVRSLGENVPLATAIASSIDELRRLLRPQRSIDETLLVGAIGELIVLRDLTHTTPEALDSWVGWRGQRHDFMSGHDSIEVKTSQGSGTTVVTIHGLEQLTPAENGHLWLHHVGLEAAPGPDPALVSLERLCLELSRRGVPEALIRQRLEKINVESDAPEWTRTFRHVRTTAFRVEGDFPRLTGSSLAAPEHAGVANVQYQIDLASARTHELARDERLAHLRSFAGLLS
jgi:hypothetical protein